MHTIGFKLSRSNYVLYFLNIRFEIEEKTSSPRKFYAKFKKNSEFCSKSSDFMEILQYSKEVRGRNGIV